MIDELIRLASHLDLNGLMKEADYLDEVIKNARLLAHKHPPWPVEMWPHQKDLVNGGGVLRAIAKVKRAGNDNISKKCADRDAIKKLSCAPSSMGPLSDITFRHFKDNDFCYAIAEISIRHGI